MSERSNPTPKSCKDAIAEWQAEHPEEPVKEAKEVRLLFKCIKKMDNKLNDLAACEHLGLSTNIIDKIQPLPGLKNLKILSLGRNNIKKIERLDEVAGTLEQLWLSYNQIEKLDGLGSLRNLKVLYISNNKIKNFDELAKLRDLPELNELLLIGNPIYSNGEITTEQARVEVVKRLPTLYKLDGHLVTEDEREAAAAGE